jgi:hypothetical protein
VALMSVAALVGGLFGSRIPHDQQAAQVGALVSADSVSAGVLLAVIIALPRRDWKSANVTSLIMFPLPVIVLPIPLLVAVCDWPG